MSLLERRCEPGGAENRGAEDGSKRWREMLLREKKNKQTERGNKTTGCTSTPKPAARTASSPRGWAAAGLHGEMGGSTAPAVPLGEGWGGGEVSVGPVPYSFTLPNAAVVMSLLMNTEEQLDWLHRCMSTNTPFNTLCALCLQVSGTNRIAATRYRSLLVWEWCRTERDIHIMLLSFLQ